MISWVSYEYFTYVNFRFYFTPMVRGHNVMFTGCLFVILDQCKLSCTLDNGEYQIRKILRDLSHFCKV